MSNKILSLDGGGVKGIYSLVVLQSIENALHVETTSHFDKYVGTSIGGVISSFLAFGVSVNDILEKFGGLKDQINQGHHFLLQKLFLIIDEIFESSRFNEISGKVFLPALDADSNKLTYFDDENESLQNILISDIIKSICCDIRLSKPFFIKGLNKSFIDAGIFAYDPILYYLRVKYFSSTADLNVLSIGSGIIKNISDDLNIEKKFDLVYDAFLLDQFYTTIYVTNQLSRHKDFKYLRISEFPHIDSIPSIDHLIALANNRCKRIDYAEVRQIL